MSLVNSFINQIGRELGRDAYSTVKPKNKSNNNSKIVDSNESLIDQVLNFELLNNDENTYRYIVNLVEKAEHSDPQDFEWQELFHELDNKIDFCKLHLSDEYKSFLEELDQINAKNYKKIKEKHIEYINTVISHFDTIATNFNKKKISIAYLLTFLGLRAAYLNNKIIYTILKVLYVFFLGFIFVNGLLTYSFPKENNGNLPNDTLSDLDRIQTTGIISIAFALFFYLIFVLIGIYKILKHKKEIQININSKNKFENYKLELMKN
jgi:hypothetical protein